MRITTAAKVGVWLWLIGAVGWALAGHYWLMAGCALAMLVELVALDFVERQEARDGSR